MPPPPITMRLSCERLFHHTDWFMKCSNVLLMSSLSTGGVDNFGLINPHVQS